ncbi:MAG: DUF1294 domain-containing protein [Alphaproteobacteria bacterium]
MVATKALSLILTTAVVLAGVFVGNEYAHFPPLVSWLLSINTTLFGVMGKDKLAAKFGGFGRTPESTIFILAAIGGFPALFLARYLFNHKTSKTQFIVVMWLIFTVEFLLAVWIASQSDLTAIGLKRKQLPIVVEEPILE